MSRRLRIVACDPPPNGRTRTANKGKSQPRKGKYDVVLSVLTKQPNRWFRISDFDDYPKAHSVALLIKRTPRYKNMAAPSRIESITRKYEVDGQMRVGVWVRLVNDGNLESS